MWKTGELLQISSPLYTEDFEMDVCLSDQITKVTIYLAEMSVA